MEENPVVKTSLNRKSIREYKTETPKEEVIEKIVKAGQHAPFVAQLCNLLLSKKREKNKFNAPLLFTFCVDFHRMELIMEKRGWKFVSNDLIALLFGMQDAAYMAENMVLAAEDLGLGSCFLGDAPYRAEKIAKKYDLPKRVFPMVQLTMGYPDEDPPTRPRYPMDFVLFKDQYPELSDRQIEEAMERMDEGYLDQDYYRKRDAKIPITCDKKDEFTYEDYSWTEHISRKWGQWFQDKEKLKKKLKACGFEI